MADTAAKSEYDLLSIAHVKQSMTELNRAMHSSENILAMATRDLPIKAAQIHFKRVVAVLRRAEAAAARK